MKLSLIISSHQIRTLSHLLLVYVQLRVTASDNFCNNPKLSSVDVTVRVIRDSRVRFIGQSQRYVVHERAAVNSTVPGQAIAVIDTDLQVCGLCCQLIVPNSSSIKDNKILWP